MFFHPSCLGAINKFSSSLIDKYSDFKCLHSFFNRHILFTTVSSSHRPVETHTLNFSGKVPSSEMNSVKSSFPKLTTIFWRCRWFKGIASHNVHALSCLNYQCGNTVSILSCLLSSAFLKTSFNTADTLWNPFWKPVERSPMEWVDVSFIRHPLDFQDRK